MSPSPHLPFPPASSSHCPSPLWSTLYTSPAHSAYLPHPAPVHPSCGPNPSSSPNPVADTLSYLCSHSPSAPSHRTLRPTPTSAPTANVSFQPESHRICCSSSIQSLTIPLTMLISLQRYTNSFTYHSCSLIPCSLFTQTLLNIPLPSNACTLLHPLLTALEV